MQYYYTLDGTTQLGPVDRDGLRAAGVGPGTMVWREGLGDWQPAGGVGELADLFPPAPPRPFGATVGTPPGNDFGRSPGSPPNMPGQQISYAPPSHTPGTNGMAIASLVCGIIGLTGFCCCFPVVVSILAIIFGKVARGQIKRGFGTGDGMAIAGMVLGTIGIVLTVLSVSVHVSNNGFHMTDPNFNWHFGK